MSGTSSGIWKPWLWVRGGASMGSEYLKIELKGSSVGKRIGHLQA